MDREDRGDDWGTMDLPPEHFKQPIIYKISQDGTDSDGTCVRPTFVTKRLLR